MPTRVAVIYYSATGNVHALARAVAEGADSAGAEVRLRRVLEIAPPQMIDAVPAWGAHLALVADEPVATVEDLEWADGVALGSPARLGNVAAPLKYFIETSGPLWARGGLAGKAMTAFASAGHRHGGNESALLALCNTLYHWGAVLVPPGYTSDAVAAAGGNPYGASHASKDGPVPTPTLEAARHQGRRLAIHAEALRHLRAPDTSDAAAAAAATHPPREEQP